MSDDLGKLRDQIDSIDEELLDLIAKRLNIAQKISECKIKKNLPVYDAKREEVKLKELRKQAELRLLDSGDIQRIFKEIIIATRKSQY